MKQTVVELVDVILQHIQEHPRGLPSETGIRTWLTRQGYAKRDIDAAMQLVRPRFQAGPHVRENGPGQVRQLSDYERFKLSSEARDALARLELYELIDPLERELILERLDHFDHEVGLEELDYLVSWVICGTREVEFQQTVFDVMEGGNRKLH